MTEHHRGQTGQPGAAPSGTATSEIYPALGTYLFEPRHRRMRFFGRISAAWTATFAAFLVYLEAYEAALWFGGASAMWIAILSLESGYMDGFRNAQNKAAEHAAETARLAAERESEIAKEHATRTAEERLAWQAATAAEIAALEAAALRQRLEWEASTEAERITREAAEAEELRARELAETPKPVKTVARSSRDGEGFIYVIQFSTGAIKVGQTVEPRTRLNKHRRDAEVYGVVIVDYWVSPQHANYLSSETLLIKHCREVATPVKKEYFIGLAFADAVAIAGRLPFVRMVSVEVAR